MLELLISILLSLGIQFTVKDGHASITDRDKATVQSAPVYIENNKNGALDDIVITTGVDPLSVDKSNAKE